MLHPGPQMMSQDSGFLCLLALFPLRLSYFEIGYNGFQQLQADILIDPVQRKENVSFPSGLPKSHGGS